MGKSFGGGRISGKKFGNGGGRDRNNFAERDGGRKEMFDAVCSECGNACQVPFRPNGKKPVLCSHCFGKESGGPVSRPMGRFDGSRREKARMRDRGQLAPAGANGPAGAGNADQLREINDKLDIILDLLQDDQDL